MSTLDDKVCIHCSGSFIPRVKTATLCSRTCMYAWRKGQNWIEKACLHCGNHFEARKSDSLPRLFCSPECHKSSEYKKQKISEWSSRADNPFKDPKKQEEYRELKMKKYGTLQVNRDKGLDTCAEKYGTKFPMLLSKSNGKRVSKPQAFVYKSVKAIYDDAILEHHIKDADIFVDVFVPSINKIIEVYGDYWHCNPNYYDSSFYHTQLHMTAQEKWDEDRKRLEKLIKLGYNVEIIWEKSIQDDAFLKTKTIY